MVAGDIDNRPGFGNTAGAVHEDRFRQGSLAVDALGAAAVFVGERIGGKCHLNLFLGRGDDPQAMYSGGGFGDEYCGIGAASGGDGAQAQLGREIEAMIVIAPDSDARCELKVGAVFQVGPKGGVVGADGIDIGQWCCHAFKQRARFWPARGSNGRACG